MQGGEGCGLWGLPGPPLSLGSPRVRRKKLTDIWEEVKNEREKRLLLEVGGVRGGRRRGAGGRGGGWPSPDALPTRFR